jgi:hypothetical protein
VLLASPIEVEWIFLMHLNPETGITDEIDTAPITLDRLLIGFACPVDASH